MHPVVSRPDRSWLVYVVMGVVGSVIGTWPLRQAGAQADEAAWFSSWGIGLMFLALHSWHIVRRAPVGTVSFARFTGTSIFAAVVFSGLWVGAGLVASEMLAPYVPSVAPAINRIRLPLWGAGAGIYLCVMLLIQALNAADEGEAAARRALESDVASRDAELRALRAQVNPHFLFNCLHSISSMTSRDPEGARRMCLELADFFRASLKAGAEQRVSLGTELQLLRRYLDIEQVRFGQRLVVEVDVAADAADVMVPPLLLQPLAENAVRHGIATLLEGGAVRIVAARVADRVEVTVENPFDPDGRRAGTGVGLANVRDRLDAAYRGLAAVRAETIDGPPPVFRVSLSIPAEGTAESAEERSGAMGPPRATRLGGVQGSPPENK